MLALLVFTFLLKSMDLKEVLAPSKLRLSSAVNQTVNKGGCFKCDKNRCDLCKNFLLHASKFRSSATEKMTVDIIHNLQICIRLPFVSRVCISKNNVQVKVFCNDIESTAVIFERPRV